MSDFYYYKIYGCILKSEIPYEQLVSCKEEELSGQEHNQIFLYKGKLSPDVLLQYQQGKKLEIKRERIWFANQYGIFQISEGLKIHIQPHSNVPMKNLTSFVFGYCMAMLFWQRGMLAIHCSAISYEGRAILIAGGSGSGKSTLTHCFLSHGAGLMCDDVAILEIKEKDILVYPAFPMQKLCKDAADRNKLNTENLFCVDEDRDKYALPFEGEFSTKPVKLGAIICLNRAGQQNCSIRQITGHDSLKAVLDNLFLKPMYENSYPLPPEDMLKCVTLAGHTKLYKLLRPMTGDTVEEQYGLILKQLEVEQ